ncbi:MAG: sterol desaturase family protein [Octadecabacter sp.]|nr:sterol desaturase family protein [Octadecabacter sp.]
MDVTARFWDSLFGLENTVSPLYLSVFIAVAWAVYVRRKETEPFMAWLFPRAIWRHKSSYLDMMLFAIGRLMSVFGVVGRFAATPLFAAWVAQALPWGPIAGGNTSPLMLAFVFWIVGDFAVYWVHRVHHSTRALWPLHAVHHSAEVMTPITVYRQHPLGILVTASIQTAIMGILLGALVGTLNPDMTMVEIVGVNAFNVVAIMALSNFHHSHLWIRYPSPLEQLFISPAMHQIHHSTNPSHFNRNFGGFLAVWDWLFGTLYLPQDKEVITLGLTAKDDAPLMTHRLKNILISPLRRMLP